MATLTSERLLEILEDDTAEPYSGRDMHGAVCWSIRTSQRLGHTLSELIKNCSDVDEAARLVLWAKTDQMGHDMVVYWPQCAAPDAPADEEDVA